MTTQLTKPSPLATPTLVVGIVATAFGVLSWIPWGLLFGFFAFFAGIAAVTIGHIAVSKSADRRARIGLALGYIGLGLMVGRIVISAVMAQF